MRGVTPANPACLGQPSGQCDQLCLGSLCRDDGEQASLRGMKGQVEKDQHYSAGHGLDL